MKDTIVEQVRQDLLNRSEVGIKKYNTTLDRDDLSIEDWIQHAYEENLDSALYLKRLKADITKLNEKFDNLVRDYKILEAENNELKKSLHIDSKRRAWHY